MEANTVNVSEYFLQIVDDPYQWLENPKSENTRDFITQERELFESYVKSSDIRQRIKDRYDIHKLERISA